MLHSNEALQAPPLQRLPVARTDGRARQPRTQVHRNVLEVLGRAAKFRMDAAVMAARDT